MPARRCLGSLWLFALAAASAGCGGGTEADPAVMRIFSSPAHHNGNFGGLVGADALCAAYASAGGLDGTFVALLADSTHPIASRIRDVGPWYLVGTSTVSAQNLNSLLYAVQEPPWRDMNGTPVTLTSGTYYFAWTGFASGGAQSDACADWASQANTDYGSMVTARSDVLASWSFSAGARCDMANQYVICVQQ